MSIDRGTLGVAASLELATYRRTIRGGIERIWENVFDWGHLPVLHETYFDAVEPIEGGCGVGGWR
jgi:phenylpropionate dioxygenase-like ring-hydroxylating dioxygenase large terminal subunit